MYGRLQQIAVGINRVVDLYGPIKLLYNWARMSVPAANDVGFQVPYYTAISDQTTLQITAQSVC